MKRQAISVKFIFTLTVLLLILHARAAGSGIFDGISSLKKDRYIHFSAGVLVSHASYPFYRKYLRNKKAAWFYSFSTAAAAGVIKEICDTEKTGFDSDDLAATVLGGATIITVKF